METEHDGVVAGIQFRVCYILAIYLVSPPDDLIVAYAFAHQAVGDDAIYVGSYRGFVFCCMYFIFDEDLDRLPT